jgi:hypothetical protein
MTGPIPNRERRWSPLPRFLVVAFGVTCAVAFGVRTEDVAAAPEKVRSPSFSKDIVPVFGRYCASEKGCHGADPTTSVNLDLRPRAAYKALVDHPAEARSGALRVKPGDPAASFLIDKLTGAIDVSEGKAMPIDAITGVPIEPSPLPPDFVNGVLTDWIRAGARRN